MTKRILTAATIALSAFILNPMIACQSEETTTYTFGEAEMRTAVAGTYTGKLASTDESIVVTLDEAKATASSTTQSFRSIQCGNRSFVRPAEACASSTTMDMAGNLTTSGSGVKAGSLSGDFSVYSNNLTFGTLSLTLDNGATLTATYDREKGGLVDWVYVDATTTLELDLTRTLGD